MVHSFRKFGEKTSGICGLSIVRHLAHQVDTGLQLKHTVKTHLRGYDNKISKQSLEKIKRKVCNQETYVIKISSFIVTYDEIFQDFSVFKYISLLR